LSRWTTCIVLRFLGDLCSSGLVEDDSDAMGFFDDESL